MKINCPTFPPWLLVLELYFLQAHSSEIKLYGRWPCPLAEVMSSKLGNKCDKSRGTNGSCRFYMRMSRRFNSSNEIQKDPEDASCQWVKWEPWHTRSYFLMSSLKSDTGPHWNNYVWYKLIFSPPLKWACLNLGKGKLKLTDLCSRKHCKRELIWLPPSPRVNWKIHAEIIGK